MTGEAEGSSFCYVYFYCTYLHPREPYGSYGTLIFLLGGSHHKRHLRRAPTIRYQNGPQVKVIRNMIQSMNDYRSNQALGILSL